MGQYQIVVRFGYGSTMKYFVYICVFRWFNSKKSVSTFQTDTFASLKLIVA